MSAASAPSNFDRARLLERGKRTSMGRLERRSFFFEAKQGGKKRTENEGACCVHGRASLFGAGKKIEEGRNKHEERSKKQGGKEGLAGAKKNCRAVPSKEAPRKNSGVVRTACGAKAHARSSARFGSKLART